MFGRPVYSRAVDGAAPPLNRPDMPSIPALRLHKKPQAWPGLNAGQHVKSKMPIFKQVRGLLQRPAPLHANANANATATVKDVGYDAFPRRMAAPPEASHVEQLAYPQTPHQAAYCVLQRPDSSHAPSRRRSLSPVSVLTRGEAEMLFTACRGCGDQVSPISDSEEEKWPVPASTVAVRIRPVTCEGGSPPYHPSQTPCPLDIPSEHSSFNLTLNEITPWDESRFSWTTYAPSVIPPVIAAAAAAATDANESPTIRSSQPSEESLPASRRSWSIASTHVMDHLRADLPPPSPRSVVQDHERLPPLPVQSILSRHRPVQRSATWTPPARMTSLPPQVARKPSPSSAEQQSAIQVRSDSPQRADKKLPPPPELLGPQPAMSRLDTLLAEEQSKIRQRTNIQRAIAKLEKSENASPLEVSFAQVRDAKKRLAELRATLAEVQLEEREVGIAMARARRKEGEDEGLWVRRITG